MKFNQNTLRIIAEGGYMPDQNYVMQMAKELLKGLFIAPRINGAKRSDGKPQHYDVFYDGVYRGNVYHSQNANIFSLEIDNDSEKWRSFTSLEDCEKRIKKILWVS